MLRFGREQDDEENEEERRRRKTRQEEEEKIINIKFNNSYLPDGEIIIKWNMKKYQKICPNKIFKN